MGRKGVSKRKPKKSFSNDNKGSSNARQGESPSVQSLANAKDAPLNRGGTNPSNGSNKKSQKGR